MQLSGDPYPISPQFEFVEPLVSSSSGEDSRVPNAIKKFQRIIMDTVTASPDRATSSSPLQLAQLELRIRNETKLSFSPYPRLDTDYSYRLTVSRSSGRAVAEASSQYGLMYAMETFVQLVDQLIIKYEERLCPVLEPHLMTLLQRFVDLMPKTVPGGF